MQTLQLTGAGKPALLEEEVEVCTIGNVTVTQGTAPVPSGAFIVRLSNLRLMLQSTSSPTHYQLELERVYTLDAPASSLFWIQTKVGLHFVAPDLITRAFVELNFKENRDFCVGKIKEQLEKKAWVKIQMQKQTGTLGSATATNKPAEFDPSKAGVTGIMKTVQSKSAHTDESLQASFRDLDALMKNAEEMVQIANKFASRLNSAEGDNEATFHQSVMHKMGIWSPVTRQTTHGAVDLYFQELARELFNFLDTRVLTGSSAAVGNSALLNINHDIIPVTDLYCIFNRARGTELISPEDLLRACEQFAPLNLPVTLRRMNGFHVVTSTRYNDSVMTAAVAETIRLGGPVTAMRLATMQKISLPLAQYYLEKAEESELLCRDESHEGIVFYGNIFR